MAQPTQQEVDKVVAAYDIALKGKEYVETFVFDVEQNSGTDYTMVWTKPTE